jgi:chromosome segregation ATPase
MVMKKIAYVIIFLTVIPSCLIYSMEGEREDQLQCVAAAALARGGYLTAEQVLASLHQFDTVDDARRVARENFATEMRERLDPERGRISILEQLVAELRRELSAEEERTRALQENFGAERAATDAQIEELERELRENQTRTLETERKLQELEAQEGARSKREDAEREYLERLNALNRAQGYA